MSFVRTAGRFSRDSSASVSKLFFVRYLGYFFALFLFCSAELAGLKPFGYGAYLALIFSGVSIFIVTPMYVAASYLSAFNTQDLICAVSMSVVIILAQAIHLRLKRPMKIWQLLIYASAGQAGYIYVVVVSKYSLISAVLTIALGLAFTLAAACVLTAVLKNKLKYRADRAEITAAAVMIMAFALGACAVAPWGVSLNLILGMFVVMCAVTSLGSARGAAVGVVYGIGTAFYQNQPEFGAIFAMFALVASIFSDYNRLLAVLAALAMEVLFALYFEVYGVYNYLNLVALALGGVFYLCIPAAVFARLGEFLAGKNDSYAVRHIINRSREDMAVRLNELSRVMSEMRVAFSGLIKGCEDDESASVRLADELSKSVCVGCRNVDFCLRQNEVRKAMVDLSKSGLKKGKLSLLDLPQPLVSKCGRTADLLKQAAQLTGEFLRYRAGTERLDTAKVLVGEQLGGMSDVLLAMSADTRSAVGFDLAAERRLIEELTYADVVAAEAIVSVERGRIACTLVVKSDTYREGVVLKTADRVLRQKMHVKRVEDSAKAGFVVVTLSRAPRFDLAIGVSGLNKHNSEVGGDTHSFTRISDERVMLALCDGMGSGSKAERVSEMAISLIENFYKAGFSTELIISSVNRLLSLALEESFSALDIAVVDLNTAQADFIKFGAPPTVVKHKSESNLIMGNALPMGAVNDVKPQVITTTLAAFDTVVLSTDGISDVFTEDSEMCNFVNNLRIQNPQTLANELVAHAHKVDKQLPHDDMTALCFRVIPI